MSVKKHNSINEESIEKILARNNSERSTMMKLST